jgi:hypothetical protein
MGLCGPCVRVGEGFGGFHDLPEKVFFYFAMPQGRGEATWSRWWCQQTPMIFLKSFINHCLITVLSANDPIEYW